MPNTRIAEAIYAFKSYATTKECTDVALEVVKKWEFLQNKNGWVNDFYIIYHYYFNKRFLLPNSLFTYLHLLIV